MGFFKSITKIAEKTVGGVLLKPISKVVNDVVPNEIKPVIKIGLAFVPGIGPALSAGYTALDAYGGGKSLGTSIGAGIKSYAISQVAGAASRSLGVTTQGNDLTDALGQTSGQGTFGSIGGATDAATKTGATIAANSAPAVAPESVAKTAGTMAASAGSSAAISAAGANTGSVLAKGADVSLLDKVGKVGAAASVLSAASGLLTGSSKATVTAPDTSAADSAAAVSAAASDAAIAEEDKLRRRRGSGSNIYTSPLGIYGQGKERRTSTVRIVR